MQKMMNFTYHQCNCIRLHSFEARWNFSFANRMQILQYRKWNSSFAHFVHNICFIFTITTSIILLVSFIKFNVKWMWTCKFSHHFFFGFLLSMYIHVYFIYHSVYRFSIDLHFTFRHFCFFFFPSFFQFSIVFCNLNGDALNESQMTKSIFFL